MKFISVFLCARKFNLNWVVFFLSDLIIMSQRKGGQKARKSDEDVIDLSTTTYRSPGKTFKKQYFEKASEEEKITFKDEEGCEKKGHSRRLCEIKI